MKLSYFALGFTLLVQSAIANENGTIKIYDARFLPQIISLLRPGILVMED
jgi:hypothetical protein